MCVREHLLQVAQDCRDMPAFLTTLWYPVHLLESSFPFGEHINAVGSEIEPTPDLILKGHHRYWGLDFSV